MVKEKKVLDTYLQKHVEEPKKIKEPPSEKLAMIVVIPAYNEPQLLDSLKSLSHCEFPGVDIEVIVVLNSAEEADVEIVKLHSQLKREGMLWAKSNSPDWLKFHFLMEDSLPRKHAGVGLARKICMDEAVQRLFAIDKAESPIVCFDADSKCQKNYFAEILLHFKNNPSTSACSIHFEHPISGAGLSDEVYEVIRHYELHLRYYKQALEFAKAPFAFHTIGSSMAVRATDYCKQGGMNRRKAGEDFYFLQKFIELGSFSEIKSTMVIPSPRASERVPFGTGRAVLQHLNDKKEIRHTYHFGCFLILKKFFSELPSYYLNEKSLPPKCIAGFLGGEEKFMQKIKELKRNSKNQVAFNKRFFRWFNAFRTLKFIHFLRDNGFEEMNVVEAALELEETMGVRSVSNHLDDMLMRYRLRDRA